MVLWGAEPLFAGPKATAHELNGSNFGVCILAGHKPPLNKWLSDPKHSDAKVFRVRCAACGSGKAVSFVGYRWDRMKLLPDPRGTLVLVSGEYQCTGCPKGGTADRTDASSGCACFCVVSVGMCLCMASL